MTESIQYFNSLNRCPNCGWSNSPYNTLCEKCHAPLRKKDGDNPSQKQEIDTRFNINHYYKRVLTCRECGNICRKGEQRCSACGSSKLEIRIACKSMLQERICGNPDCHYRTLSRIHYCPTCGTELEKGPICMVYEDHAGLPIPTPEECFGEWEDEL